MSALGQKQTFAVRNVVSALPPKADILGLRSLKANAAKITIHLSRVMGLSDRDGSHVRVDGRVDLVRAVCGRADPFGNRNGSTVRR